MKQIKECNNFIYRYNNDNKEVAIAYLAFYSGLAAQLAVHERVKGKLEPTGRFVDLVYNG